MNRLKSRGKYWVMNGKALRRIVENGAMLQFAVFFCVGILIISIIMKKNGNIGIWAELSELCLRYYKLKEGQGIFTNCIDALLICGVFLFGAMVSGFSVLGGMWLSVLSFMRGALIGMAVGTLYRTNTTVGLGYTAIVLLPAAVLSAFSFLLACKQSKKFSRCIAENGIKETGRRGRGVLSEYFLKECFCTLLTVGACLTGAVLQRLFGGFFTIV